MYKKHKLSNHMHPDKFFNDNIEDNFAADLITHMSGLFKVFFTALTFNKHCGLVRIGKFRTDIVMENKRYHF